MSIIKRALDKAEQENKGEKVSPHFNAPEEEQDKKINDKYKYKESGIDRNFEPGKLNRNIKVRVKHSNKDSFADNLFFYMLIIVLIISIPFFVKFNNKETEFVEASKLGKDISMTQNSTTDIEPVVDNTEKKISDKTVNPKSNSDYGVIIVSKSNNSPQKNVRVKTIRQKVFSKTKSIELTPEERIRKSDDMYQQIISLVNEGDKGTARALLITRVNEGPKEERFIKLLAELDYNLGNYENAVSGYKKLIELYDDTESYFKAGLCYKLFLKNKDEAEKFFKKYIDKKGKNAEEVKKMINLQG